MTRNMFVSVVAAVVVFALIAGCRSYVKKKEPPAGTQPAEKGKHEAYHGGCLNAIEKCSCGHAEVVVDGKVIKCWFVGGENETGTAVRVPATQIDLAVTKIEPAVPGDAGQAKHLILQPRPNPNGMGHEKVGDCSYFEGQADWLDGVKKFDAESLAPVRFKGQDRLIKIEYPEGYDPD